MSDWPVCTVDRYCTHFYYIYTRVFILAKHTPSCLLILLWDVQYCRSYTYCCKVLDAGMLFCKIWKILIIWININKLDHSFKLDCISRDVYILVQNTKIKSLRYPKSSPMPSYNSWFRLISNYLFLRKKAYAYHLVIYKRRCFLLPFIRLQRLIFPACHFHFVIFERLRASAFRLASII
jgi:hypothetical protein